MTQHSALIATINPKPGTVTGVLLTEGGSPRDMLGVLPLFYTRRQTRRLVRLGGIKRLGHRLEPFSDRHSFDDPEPGTTLAYVRDGGYPDWETPGAYVTCPDIRAAAAYADQHGCRFVYLIDRRGRWHWQRVSAKLHHWIMLPLNHKTVAEFYGLQA